MNRAVANTSLSIECLEAPAPTGTARVEWDSYIVQTEAEIYFISGWLEAWWHHYGASFSTTRQPVCFIFRDGKGIVGLLPFCIEEIRAGPFAIRIARLAGVDPNFAIMKLPIDPEHETSVLDIVFDHLVSKLDCDALSLSPLSDRSPQLETIRDAGASGNRFFTIRDTSWRGHTLMDLPESPDAFLAALSKSRRREFRRDLKRLTQGEPLCNISSTPETSDQMMDRFIELHTRQWEAAGKGGHFSDWRAAAPFYRELLHELAPAGQAAIDEQWLGDTLLSSQLRYSLGEKAYWWLNARAIDPRFEKIGLGRVGLVERASELIRSGIRLIEAGAGEYEYKLSYGGEFVPIHSLVLARKRPVARLRARTLLLWADAIHLFYYRIWFLKIRPRLGLRPRALWTTWIRSRL